MLELNALGLEPDLTKRKKVDGVTYFGSMKNSLPDKFTGEKTVLNDYVIPQPEDPGCVLQKADRHRGRHFKIWYKPQLASFMIQDLGVGLGTYMKITKPFKLFDY